MDYLDQCNPACLMQGIKDGPKEHISGAYYIERRHTNILIAENFAPIPKNIIIMNFFNQSILSLISS